MVIAGNVQVVRANNVTFANTTIIGDPTANTATVDFIRNSTGVRINGNYIVRIVRPANNVTIATPWRVDYAISWSSIASPCDQNAFEGGSARIDNKCRAEP